MARFLWICLGGGAGTGARYLFAAAALRLLGTGFAYGTLLVNLVGSFLLAFVLQIGLTTNLLGPTLRLALATGVLGGFTTYSTFSYETMVYFREGAFALALANVAATVLGCLVASFLGWGCARWIFGG